MTLSLLFKQNILKTLLIFLFKSLLLILTLAFAVWGFMAIYLLAPWPGIINIILALFFVFAFLAATFIPATIKVRTLRALSTIFLILFWYQQISPEKNRTWIEDVRVLPDAKIIKDQVEITNVRAYNYRSETDYDVRYETKTYDLGELTHIDLFMSYWGSPSIAHPILSFGFSDGQQLAISIETRKEIGETYSAINGFFKVYELIYIPALETDVIKLRTNYRNEDVYLYRLRASPERSRRLLEKYIERIHLLNQRAEFYNAVLNNCTTNIFFSFQSLLPILKMDYRVVLSGYLDEFAYHNGSLYQDLPFAELKKKSYISLKAKAVKKSENFSSTIREGLLISSTYNN